MERNGGKDVVREVGPIRLDDWGCCKDESGDGKRKSSGGLDRGSLEGGGPVWVSPWRQRRNSLSCSPFFSQEASENRLKSKLIVQDSNLLLINI